MNSVRENFIANIQVVSYTADDNGFHPTVEYKGKAHFEASHQSSLPLHHPQLQALEKAYEEPRYKYNPTPTPYPPGPKVFRPKAKSTLFKYSSDTPLNYKGKLVFLGNDNDKQNKLSSPHL